MTARITEQYVQIAFGPRPPLFPTAATTLGLSVSAVLDGYTRITEQYIQIALAGDGVDPLAPVVETTLGLSVTASITGDFLFQATSSIAFIASASIEIVGIPVSASNTLFLLNTAKSGFFILRPITVLGLVASARVPAVIDVSRTSTLDLSIFADSGLVDLDATTPLGLRVIACAAVNGIPGCTDSTLALVATATYLMSFNAVAPFIPSGGFEPLDPSESLYRMAAIAEVNNGYTNLPDGNALLLRDVASIQVVNGKFTFNGLDLTHSATRLMEYTRAPANDLGLRQSAIIQHFRDGKPVGGFCTYSPFLSEDSPMPSTYVSTPGMLTLQYPAGTPTTTLVLRNSQFGDSYDLGFDRINAINRGNELIVYGDTHWPEIETFSLRVSSLTAAQRDSIISFTDLTLGRTIRLTDHFGQVWNVYITTPDADFIDARGDDCSFVWEITCEGTRV